ncbi:MAG: hypothetical protein U9N86_10165, partial [Bacteroidota bacterium]|nr:hypothetical protein [Bacteroidota bacterium]
TAEWNRLTETLTTQVDEGLLTREAAADIVEAQLTSAENIVDANNTALWKRLVKDLKTQISEGNLTRKHSKAIVDAQIAGQFKVAYMQDKTTRHSLKKNLKHLRSENLLDREQEEDIIEQAHLNKMDEIDAMNLADAEEAEAWVDWLREEKYLDAGQAREVWTNKIIHDVRMLNLTKKADKETAAQMINYYKERDVLDATTTKEVTLATLQYQAKALEITTEAQLSTYFAGLRADLETFGISTAEQHWYASQILGGMAEDRKGTQLGSQLQIMDMIFASPEMSQFIFGVYDEDTDKYKGGNNALVDGMNNMIDKITRGFLSWDLSEELAGLDIDDDISEFNPTNPQHRSAFASWVLSYDSDKTSISDYLGIDTSVDIDLDTETTYPSDSETTDTKEPPFLEEEI